MHRTRRDIERTDICDQSSDASDRRPCPWQDGGLQLRDEPFLIKVTRERQRIVTLVLGQTQGAEQNETPSAQIGTWAGLVGKYGQKLFIR